MVNHSLADELLPKGKEEFSSYHYKRIGGNVIAVLVYRIPFLRRNIDGPSKWVFKLPVDRAFLESRVKNLKARGFPCEISEAALKNFPVEL